MKTGNKFHTYNNLGYKMKYKVFMNFANKGLPYVLSHLAVLPVV